MILVTWVWKRPWVYCKNDSFGQRWQQMLESISRLAKDVHVSSCPKRAEMKTITASYPLQLIHLDFLMIGTGSNGNKNVSVLIVTNHFTRYAAAYVMPKQTAPIVSKVLWEKFLVNYGWPEKILIDQGKNFESSLLRELCELAGVQKLRTTPYHPEINGQCKHFNQMLINMIGTVPTHAKNNWQEWVSTLVSAYNSTVSNSTSFSPYFLMYSCHPRIPIDIEFGVTQVDISGLTHENYIK